MKGSKIIFLLIFVAIFFWLFYFWNDFYFLFSLKLPEIEKGVRGLVKKEIEKEISLPPPIRAEKEYSKAILTKEGIIKWTNLQRENFGLPPLKENLKLDASSAIKVEDMFENQYFAHYSLSGEGVGDLAKIVDYQFILIGENLALGNFKDDETLVKAWMESQGHRENILNKKYQEIGVAVKKGIFEGKETWMAVQHFGLPLSACPQPDEKLKVKIESNEIKIYQLQKTLGSLQIEIKNMRPKRGSAFEQKIDQYNALVSEYNAILEETENLIEDYNNQVRLFNECVAE